MFGLYVHIPFCVHRCSYCDFYSSTGATPAAFEKIAQKLCWEAEVSSDWLSKHRSLPAVDSVFFGGGTPSLMPMEGLSSIFEKIGAVFPLKQDAEITLEANPETVTPTFVSDLLRRTPVNRVSMGAQSFHSKYLQVLERLGSAESIRTAVSRLREGGLRNYSLDLIFGIPGQSVEELIYDIDQAVALEPKHLSFYSLTLKAGHKLYSGLPSDDEAADLYERGVERLSSYGFRAYEISNFSLPGFESRHNLLYWSGGDYLGLGPSAASRFFWEGVFHHKKQVSNWERYLLTDTFLTPEFEATNRFQTVLEAGFLELRKREGVSREGFLRRYAYDLGTAPRFAALHSEGLLEEVNGQIRLTPKGWLLAEGIAESLIEKS